MQPIVKLSIIQGVKLNFNRIVVIVQLKVQMDTSIAIIRRFASGQIRQTE